MITLVDNARDLRAEKIRLGRPEAIDEQVRRAAGQALADPGASPRRGRVLRDPPRSGLGGVRRCVCQAPGDAQVVGDQDDGEAVSVPRAGEQVDEVFLGEDVEAARRFVGEQNVWFGGEGAR